VAATPAARFRLRTAKVTDTRSPRVERLGLAAVSLVIGLGLWLAYAQQAHSVAGCRAEGAASPSTAAPCVNLNTLRRASDLAPALRVFSEPAERTAVAAAIVNHAVEAGRPFDHVGTLASITIPAQKVRSQKS